MVFDLTERITFNKISRWVNSVQDQSPEAVIYLIGNQCDLAAQRTVSRQEAETFATQNGLQYAETSAFSGIGIDLIVTHRFSAKSHRYENKSKIFREIILVESKL